ncbi:MAG: DUF1540 domain-containing protein [Defluviitaleaceae bacterium]|nr:DUF1540 domain-containing protein [Defluviitaleaceae bacterium]
MASQQIMCNVSSCKYNSDSRMCSLSSIEVGNTIPNAQNMHQTECASFKSE